MSAHVRPARECNPEERQDKERARRRGGSEGRGEIGRKAANRVRARKKGDRKKNPVEERGRYILIKEKTGRRRRTRTIEKISKKRKKRGRVESNVWPQQRGEGRGGGVSNQEEL